jgi:ABC-2 type transport system ATP-binding protein
MTNSLRCRESFRAKREIGTWRIEMLLEMKDIRKSFGKGDSHVEVLRGISLGVEKGEFCVLLGPSGSGKSTLLNIIGGIDTADSGEILIDGHSVRDDPMACKRVTAYIPDNPDLYENLTGIQYLNFVADVFEIGASERETRIRRYADLFEITDALGSLISSYSHGMKQKVAIISALIHEPKLLVLDEPFVGLDPKATFTLKEIMREMCRKGTAVFFSTHVLDVAEKLCNKVAIIRQGRILFAGTMEEFTEGHSLEEAFLEADK